MDYVVELKETFVEFFTLSPRKSDGLACWSYGHLVERGRRSSKFVTSAHWLSDKWSSRSYGHLIRRGHKTSEIRQGFA